MTVIEPPPAMTEGDMIAALHARYGQVVGNGRRWAVAGGVRSHAGFDARRTADFIAMDTWPSKGLEIHGHEVKVSRSDWLRELKEPEKAAEFIPYVNRWWLVVPDPVIVGLGELPDGWGLLAMRGGRLAVIEKAARRDALPLPPTRLAALLRAVEGTAANQAVRDRERLFHSHLRTDCGTQWNGCCCPTSQTEGTQAAEHDNDSAGRVCGATLRSLAT
jgi:hypothetical protein